MTLLPIVVPKHLLALPRVAAPPALRPMTLKLFPFPCYPSGIAYTEDKLLPLPLLPLRHCLH